MLNKKYWLVIAVSLSVAGCVAQAAPATPTGTISPEMAATVDGDVMTKPWAPTPTPTTTLPPCRYEPEPMPEGTIRFVYALSDFDEIGLWYRDEDAEPVQIADYIDVTQIKISTEGDRVAFIRGSEEQQELWVTDIENPLPRRLLTYSQMNSMALSAGAVRFSRATIETWVPSSDFLLLVLMDPTDEGNWFIRGKQIWRVDVETGSVEFLRYGGFFLSPNGEYLGIMDGTTIDIISIDGEIVWEDVLQGYPLFDEIGRQRMSWINWAQDSQSFLLSIPDSSRSPGGRRAYSQFTVTRFWIGGQTTEAVGKYVGVASLTMFSPNHKFMFYLPIPYSSSGAINFVDLETGEDSQYVSRDRIWFYSWRGDSFGFVFADDIYSYYQLGNICLSYERTVTAPLYTFRSYLYQPTSSLLLADFLEYSWHNLELKEAETFETILVIFAEHYDYVVLPAE